jgi:hypothetical protein
MTIRYIAKGNIRGECPHRHRTLAAAQRRADRDDAGCRRQGGYSDREALVVEDGEPRPLNDDELEELFGLTRGRYGCPRDW